MVGRKKRWAGPSRSETKVKNNLGIIAGSAYRRNKRYRLESLEEFDKYVENRQYDHLADWDAGSGAEEEYISIRKRKPRIIYNFGKTLVDRVTAKLVGQNVMPTFRIEDDPKTEELIKFVMKQSKFTGHLPEIIRKMLTSGSSFARFFIVGDTIKIESFNSKYCYPIFDEDGSLIENEVRYVYCDQDDHDAQGNPKEKWFRMTFGQMKDVLFDNPDYKEGEEPLFTEVSSIDHNMGFVQGEWFRTTEDKHSPDGYSLLTDILGFIDAINYNLSQSDQAVNYSQEPQLGLTGMDTEEIDKLIKSSTKAWNLGRDGKASFIEADLNGIKVASDLRDHLKMGIQDIARVILLDPEKIVAHAQSAKAMEVLHGPLVDLINELRPAVEDNLISFIVKMTSAIFILQAQGLNEVVDLPKDYVPVSSDITAVWPPIFPMTMLDLQQKCTIAVQVGNANLISRDTLTSWLARDFGVEDIEAEIAKIKAQPVLNPFSAF